MTDAVLPAVRPRTNLRWMIALLLGCGVLVNYIDRVGFSVAQEPLHQEFGIGPAEYGVLSSAFFWVYALCQLPVGMLLDRFGVRLVGRVGAFLWGVASVLTALAPNYGVLAATRGFLGVAEAPAFPGNAMAIGRWFPLAERGLATAIFDAAAKASNVVAIPLVAYLVVTYGWRAAFAFTALLSFAYFALFAMLYRDPSHDARLREEERRYIVEGGAIPEGASARTEGVRLSSLLANRKVIGLTLGFSAYGYLFGFLLTWLPGYLKATFHTSLLGASGLAAIPWIVATIADLLVGGWLVDALIARGHSPTRVRQTVLIAGMVLGLAIVGAAFTTDLRVAMAFVTVALGGVAFSAPVAWSIPALIAPRGSVGTVGAIVNCCNNFASAAAPIATGLIVARTGSFQLALVSACVVLLLGIVSYVVVLGEIAPVPKSAS